MRFRMMNSAQQISDALDDLISLVGEKKLIALLSALKRGISLRGFVSSADYIKHTLSLQVLYLCELRRKHGRLLGFPDELYPAVDMIIGIGQLAKNLSPPARAISSGEDCRRN